MKPFNPSPSLCAYHGAMLCSLLALTVPLAAADGPAATVSENANEIVMGNGLLALTIAKRSGMMTSIKFNSNGRLLELGNGRDAFYFDANGGPTSVAVEMEPQRPKAGLAHPLSGGKCRIIHQGPDAAEVAIAGKPTFWFPFRTEAHFVLPRSQSGFYAYVVYEHGQGMAASTLEQTRFVAKSVPGTRIFTHHIADEQRKGPFPTAATVETVQDATFRLEDGSVYTKYDNTIYEADHHVHGMAGHGIGIWMIFPSNEFIGGGPLKQDLSVHMDNVLLAMLLGGHFGSGGLEFKENESWTKLYGPVFVYVNQGASVDALWDDAKRCARQEISLWPYTWLRHSEYPLERGTVTGRIQLAGPPPSPLAQAKMANDGDSTTGAWVILAPPGEDWTQSSKGYGFWTKADAEGRFTIPKVRPGRYTLFVSGANQFEDFQKENVIVQEGKPTDLGDFIWQPVKHGKRLWQIGVADRSAHEFKGGDNYRHYGSFLRYPKEFPDDVMFVIGKSKESADWNFAHWTWYCKKPFWTIQFTLDQALAGKATLTIGFASAQPAAGASTSLAVKANGKEIGIVHLKKSGSAGYRSGCQDSLYNWEYLPFDAGLLKAGPNEITLGHAGAIPFPAPDKMQHARLGQVMYDAIRLEAEEGPPAPWRANE